MKNEEAWKFQKCHSVTGESCDISTGRRNGRPVLLFGPEFSPVISESTAAARGRRERILRHELYHNLTEIQRRTWRFILQQWSISAIAREEKRSRRAIYQRIEGNSRDQGGMVRKNPYVALWWARRLRIQLALRLRLAGKDYHDELFGGPGRRILELIAEQSLSPAVTANRARSWQPNQRRRTHEGTSIHV